MAWAKPQFGHGRVDAAGKALLKQEISTSEFEEVLHIINNWRSCHSYPLLTMRITLSSRAKRVNPSAIIAQRLKRLSSIRIKLFRNRNMKFSQMHDIGGCRAIMKSVPEVERLVKTYEESRAKNPKRGAEFVKAYDYIQSPKPDGYRGIHLVYKYRSSAPKHRVYNGMRIEIQLRSALQHAWATAVETVSTFTDQALKYHIGDEDWKRFFVLMGSAIAIREARPVVPGAPSDRTELKRELRSLSAKLNAEATLQGWGTAVQHIPATTPKGAAAYLLVLDPSAKTITVEPYRRDEIPKAETDYLEEEKKIGSHPGMQVVLVSVDSITALRKAYPNYYLDTTAFVNALRHALQ
jgi:ppGpp synthetase/RelA/SpoT-type nucleotidyltranferase